MRAHSSAIWMLAVLPLAAVSAAATPLPFGTAVADAALDGARGGFTSPDNNALHVSFGVQRAVQVDGNRVPATQSSAGGGLLVQLGDGNRAIGAASASTIVQNTLDNQKLQVVTTIDVQTDSLRLSRALALQSTVGLGIAASLRR